MLTTRLVNNCIVAIEILYWQYFCSVAVGIADTFIQVMEAVFNQPIDTSDGTIWPWGKMMDTILYCTKYRDTIRYDTIRYDTIQCQNAALCVNSPRLM